MDRFGLYAKYYDLLYRDKDYAAEAAYVDHLIKAYSPGATTLLNLGSGTGRHDYELARLGYKITGVDISAEMIEQAEANLPADLPTQPEFTNADIRAYNSATKFDAVVSLFHVMSYQVANSDVIAVINTAYQHLETGGLFIFDCWYGPGVLTVQPEVRVKHMQDSIVNVTRTAEPIIHPGQNAVDVNYTIFISEHGSDEATEIRELHQMRYFFEPEIELMITSKFRTLQVNEWLTDKNPAIDSWNAVFVLQKI